MTQKSKYQSKSVKFGGKEITLFSLDGLTWSTRRDELQGIHERHEQQKITFAQLKGEAAPEGAAGASPAMSKPTAMTKRYQNANGQKPKPQVEEPAPKKEVEQPAVVAKAKVAAPEKSEKPAKAAAKPAKAPAPAPKDATPKKRASGKPTSKSKVGKKRAA